jgi:two-component system sensor histidine kinase BaeS
MRSLVVKLTLAFLIVGLTGAVLVAVIVRQRTQSAFNQFILNSDQQILVSTLIQYYQVNGSWKGVGSSLEQSLSSQPRDGGRGHEQPRTGIGFTLVGTDKVIVYSTINGQTGQALTARELEGALPLTVDNENAGWLLLTSGRRDWAPDTPESEFLKNVTSASLLTAVVASLLALTIGGFLALTLTRSLRELKEATVELAQGKLGKQVKVRSKDEVGELAVSFNQMSRDLERATQLRRQMTADIAHDLRSPLSVITGYAEALSDGKLPGSPEVFAILHQETRHLDRLVEDLRLLSLADAGELPLVLQVMPARVLLERVAARHTVTASQKDIILRIEAPPHLPEIHVDVERMAQVFDNLVLNAFRYTPAGGEIVLSGKTAPDGVLLSVHDNGRGIAPEDMPLIFDRFYRGDKARQLGAGESGLGLAIAKSIVEAHCGSIMVESTTGAGALFTIFIPLSKVSL